MVRVPRLRVLLGFIILIAVLIVFIAAFVDLEPKALRAWRAALAVFLAIVMLAQVNHSFLPGAGLLSGMQSERKGRSSHVRQDASLCKLNYAIRC